MTDRRMAALAVLTALLAAAPAAACPFCNSSGKTLTGSAAEANLVLFGSLSNPQLNPSDINRGTTDLLIEAVVKDHPILNGRKTLTLNRYLPVDKDNPVKYLVLFDVFNGKLDPYQGIAVKMDSKIADYLKGALAVKEKDVTTRLRYFFDYLDTSDLELSADAYTEFGNADYKDYRPLAAKLPPDMVVKWLRDPNTPAQRLGLYGSMLGHCGNAQHAAVLRQMLDDPEKRFTSGLDGMLAGYVMLQPKEGWAYVADLLKNRKRDFLMRYAALRAVRFFGEFRPDLVEKKELVAALLQLTEQDDIADLAIEDLRKWGSWEAADKVLALYGQSSHDIPIIRRAILRFALSCPPMNAKAADFVKAMEAKDKDWVKDVRELLELEMTPPKPPVTAVAPARPSGGIR